MKDRGVSPGVKRVLLIVLSVVLFLTLVVLIMGTAYMERMLNLINKKPDDSTISREEYEQFQKEQATEPTSFIGETIDPNDVELELNDQPVENREHIINIMLVGQDRRPGEGRTRSDVMILCTINKATKELTMTSFMRDLYVSVPGYGEDKMNHAYAYGGMKLLDKTMAENFGVSVDGNVEVDFEGFKDVIDLMGGVDIYLSNAEANYMLSHGYNVFNGTNHLDGEAALFYTRNRSVGNGDFSRTQRQRKVLNALFQKCKGMNLAQLQNLMEAVLPMITTDLSNREILDYLVDIVPLLGDMKVNDNRIPADDSFKYASIRGMSVLLPDLEANRVILKEIMERTVRPTED